MAAFETPLVHQLLTGLPRPSPSTSTSSMPPRQEGKSTILAQFPPGQQPAGIVSSAPDPTTNLLDSTPPQIVRALGQAEPLVRGLNVLLGLLTWTSDQGWQSFFLVVAWWITCLYGELIVKYAGNFIPVVLIVAWYLFHGAGVSPTT